MSANDGPGPLAILLQRYRGATGLSQDQLARLAHLSRRGIADLERGARRLPHPTTVRQLAEALGLTEMDRAALVEAAGGTTGLSAPVGVTQVRMNLPIQLTRFVGRERELIELKQLLADVRLLTLTGAGGIGKTRLALEAADSLVDLYSDGVWWVELAPLTDQANVSEAVGSVLRVRDQTGRPRLRSIMEHIGSQRLLLVLDNCEHLAEACAELVAALLRGCPRLQILDTSRQPLGVAGEVVWQVPPLSVPDANRVYRADEMMGYEAVALFIDRARSAMPRFTLTDGNTGALVHICRRLDGLPLAIELAAARVRLLHPEQIAERLHDRFRLLTGDGRNVLPRQQTLRGTIDWSYSLLGPRDQLLLDRLAVFAGSWTLEAAEAICAGGDLPGSDVLDALGRLLDRSLVIPEQQTVENRYRLLETIRQYAWERLVERAESNAVQDCHATYFARLAEKASPELRGPRQAAWLDRLARDHDNLRAAFRWGLDHDLETAMHLASALTDFWIIHGHRIEGLGWLTAALEKEAPGSSLARASVLRGAGALANTVGQFDRAVLALQEALKIYRHAGDRSALPGLLTDLGSTLNRQGQNSQAMVHLEEARALARELRDDAHLPEIYWILGRAHGAVGNLQRAVAVLEDGIAFARQVGDEHYGAHMSDMLADQLRRRGDLARARALHLESLRYFEALADPEGTASALQRLGLLALDEGDCVTAASKLCRSVRVFEELGDRIHIAACLESLARVAAAQRKFQLTATLLGAAESLREALGTPAPPIEHADLERTVSLTRSELAQKALQVAWQRGRSMPLEQIIDLACELDADASAVDSLQVGDAGPPTHGRSDPLTRRECEVAVLIARGCTNRAIAETLVISDRTAEKHVANILNKLGLDTRAQVAVWVVERGLLH